MSLLVSGVGCVMPLRLNGNIAVFGSGSVTYTDQYTIYDDACATVPASTVYTEETIYDIRKRIVGTVYEIDAALTDTGFDGDENYDWVWIYKTTGQTANFRTCVRDGAFVVDCEITETGFDGTEDVDWENLSSTEPVVVTSEDLTTYTQVDPEDNLATTADKLTVTNIHPEHTTTYLYYDFGANYFKKDFEIRFALKVTDMWTQHALQGIIGVARTVGLAVEGPRIRLNYDYQDAGEGANYVLGVGGGDHVAHGNQNQFLIGTTYYIKFQRIYVGGEADNYVLATAYTDPDYTVVAKYIYGGQIGEDIAPWGDNDFSLAHATEEFRYLIIASSSRDEYSASEVGSFEISDVEIISNE